MPTLALTDPSNGVTSDATMIANNNAALKALLNAGLDNNNLLGAPALVSGEVPVWDGTKFVRSSATRVNYSSLGLTGNIVNADINAAAAIAGSKLATGIAGPPGSELDHTEFTGIVTANNVAEAAATVIVTSGPVVLDGFTSIMVEFVCNAIVAGGSLVGGINLWQKLGAGAAVDIGRLYDATTVNEIASDYPGRIAPRRLPALAAGTYVFSARIWCTTVANLNVTAGAGGAGTKVPGYIRTTKAA